MVNVGTEMQVTSQPHHSTTTNKYKPEDCHIIIKLENYTTFRSAHISLLKYHLHVKKLPSLRIISPKCHLKAGAKCLTELTYV